MNGDGHDRETFGRRRHTGTPRFNRETRRHTTGHVLQQCGYCGQDIVFLMTTKGARMPCSLFFPDGSPALAVDEIHFSRTKHRSHFADCEGSREASRHRAELVPCVVTHCERRVAPAVAFCDLHGGALRVALERALSEPSEVLALPMCRAVEDGIDDPRRQALVEWLRLEIEHEVERIHVKHTESAA